MILKKYVFKIKILINKIENIFLKFLKKNNLDYFN